MSIFIIYRHNMNVSLTKKQEEYIAEQISSGDYQNASELVRDALRLHRIYRDRVLQDLRLEIDNGWYSPDSPRSVGEILKSKV